MKNLQFKEEQKPGLLEVWGSFFRSGGKCLGSCFRSGVVFSVWVGYEEETMLRLVSTETVMTST